MNTLTKALYLCLSVEALATNARAVEIKLQPSTPSVAQGETIVLTLLISGTTGHASPSIAGFDFDLSYDPSVLTAESVVFGTFLNTLPGGPQQLSDSSSPGSVRVSEVSFETSAYLDGIQPDSFTLATLAFRGLASGTSPIAFAYSALSDADGSSLTAFDLAGARVTISSSAPVPDTGPTVSLLGLGVAGLLGLVRPRLTATLTQRAGMSS